MNPMKNKNMIAIVSIVAALFCSISFADSGEGFKVPKYVFYFIGDGMATPQVHATEAYLASLYDDDISPGGIKAKKLTMSKFPYLGMQTSYANNRFITGSAAAGTALACGMKTNIGVISMNPDGTAPYRSLAEAAKSKGMKVAIISSVSIDHATPAVFYAHTPSRINYEKIGEFLLNSNFDFFGGGGFLVNWYRGPDYAGKTGEQRNSILEKKAVSKGFVFANTRAEFDALKKSDGRMIAVNPYLDRSCALPYELNRMSADGPGEEYEGSISLAEFTQKGIELLANSEGFFMMVEGGKIDWACHANDARTAIEDVIAFDKAIGVAVDFAKKHPSETLIVVTGDHECGGMTLGFAGTAYDTYYEKMNAQTVAFDDFGGKVFARYAATHNPAPEDIDADMWRLILNNYGMDGAALTPDKSDDLTEYEINILEDAFDQTLKRESSNSRDENRLLYGSYHPLTVTLTHLLNRKSGVTWSSYSHTAVPVPVFAMGNGASAFNGYYDNTDVAKKIAGIMKIEIGE